MEMSSVKLKLVEISRQLKDKQNIETNHNIKILVKLENAKSTRIKLNYLLILNLVSSLNGSEEFICYDDEQEVEKTRNNLYGDIDDNTITKTITVTGRHTRKPVSDLETIVSFNDKFDVGTISDLASKNFEIITKAGNSNEDLSKKFARSKAIFSVLQSRKNRELVEKELLESQIGISVQYSHVRLEGIKRYLLDIGFENIDITEDLINRADLTPLCTHNVNNQLQLPPKLVQLIIHMTKFNEHRIRGLNEPSIFINYVAMLARMVSSLYYHFRIKNEEESIQIARWIVFGLAQRILYISISVTGLTSMEIV